MSEFHVSIGEASDVIAARAESLLARQQLRDEQHRISFDLQQVDRILQEQIERAKSAATESAKTDN